MLVPIQKAGEKPPLFFVHGVYGIMCLGSSFARALGPDQPLYAVNASGIDGLQPVVTDFGEMVRAYVDEIRNACPTGPVRIGAMCSGCLLAVEIARGLQQDGRETGPVILADPPAVPPGYDRRKAEVDERDPRIAQQLYAQARRALLDHAERPYNDMPFDWHDPDTLHAATLAGMSSSIALARHTPTPFAGSAALIISAERAPGFFHPQMPWSKLLPGRRMIHVLPWDHQEIFRSGRETVGRLLKFLLEDAAFDSLGDRTKRGEATAA